MDRTQPRFDCRKGLLKKCVTLRKHDYSRTMELLTNKMAIIFYSAEKGTMSNFCWSCEKDCHYLVQPICNSWTPEEIFILPRAFLACFKKRYSKSPLHCSPAFRCKANGIFYDYGLPIFTLESSAIKTIDHQKIQGRHVVTTRSSPVLLRLTLNHPDLHSAAEMSMPYVTGKKLLP